MRTTFLWMPTMKCNLKCGHCHFKIESHEGHYFWKGYNKGHRIDKEIEWHEWLKFLDQFRPYHLELSGGEPLLYKGTKQVLSHIPFDSTWAITSNTLLDVSGISCDRCLCWTASYHHENEYKFIENLSILVRQGIVPKVSVVVEFNDFDKCVSAARRLHKDGWKVNLLRELNPHVNWEGSPKWDTLVKMRDEGFNVVEEDIPSSYKFTKGGQCRAGHEYFCLMPDGMVYRCYSQAMNHDPLGTVQSFRRLPDYSCKTDCLGCALDHKFRIKP